MEIEFSNPKLERLYTDRDFSPKWYSRNLIENYVDTINLMEAAIDIRDIYAQPGLACEKLSWIRKWQYSVRLNKQRRLIFTINNGWEIQIVTIEEISKHYE